MNDIWQLLGAIELYLGGLRLLTRMNHFIDKYTFEKYILQYYVSTARPVVSTARPVVSFLLDSIAPSYSSR